LLLTHAVAWSLALLLFPTLLPHRQLLAEGFSSLAIVAMSTNLVLSTRAPILERGLWGLDKLFVTHRTIGLSVAALVSTHFLLMPKSVGFVPAKPFGYTTISILLLAIFIASAPRFPWARLVPLNYQTWKFSHRFMGLVVALAVGHSLLSKTFVKQAPLLTVYVYGLATLGLLAWLYRELAFAHFGPFHTSAIEHSRPLGGDITEITLTPPTPVLTRTAGQFAIATFANGPSREPHPFTISSGATEAPRLSIKASGDFTGALQAGVAPSSAVRLEGPYGTFSYLRGGPYQLWLAGGIGLTPFLAMAQDLDAEPSVLLVWSVHDRGEAVYEQELVHAAERKPNLEFQLHPTGELGHFELAALHLKVAASRYSVFICGPLPMRKALIRQARSLGVRRDQIFFEEFRLR